jgi:hypothetical protein
LGCLCSSSRLQHWLWLLYVPGIPEGSHRQLPHECQRPTRLGASARVTLYDRP